MWIHTCVTSRSIISPLYVPRSTHLSETQSIKSYIALIATQIVWLESTCRHVVYPTRRVNNDTVASCTTEVTGRTPGTLWKWCIGTRAAGRKNSFTATSEIVRRLAALLLEPISRLWSAIILSMTSSFQPRWYYMLVGCRVSDIRWTRQVIC